MIWTYAVWAAHREGGVAAADRAGGAGGDVKVDGLRAVDAERTMRWLIIVVVLALIWVMAMK